MIGFKTVKGEIGEFPLVPISINSFKVQVTPTQAPTRQTEQPPANLLNLHAFYLTSVIISWSTCPWQASTTYSESQVPSLRLENRRIFNPGRILPQSPILG